MSVGSSNFDVAVYERIRTEAILLDDNIELELKLLQQEYIIARIDRRRAAETSRLELEHQKREIEHKLRRLDEDEKRAVAVEEKEMCERRIKTNKQRQLAITKETTYIKNKKNPYVEDARRST